MIDKKKVGKKHNNILWSIHHNHISSNADMKML